MAMEAFKDTISNGLQFYFKPKNDGQGELFYIVENYRGKIKPFKLVQRKGADVDKGKWQISADAVMPDDVRGLEADFGTAVETER